MSYNIFHSAVTVTELDYPELYRWIIKGEVKGKYVVSKNTIKGPNRSISAFEMFEVLQITPVYFTKVSKNVWYI